MYIGKRIISGAWGNHSRVQGKIDHSPEEFMDDGRNPKGQVGSKEGKNQVNEDLGNHRATK